MHELTQLVNTSFCLLCAHRGKQRNMVLFWVHFFNKYYKWKWATFGWKYTEYGNACKIWYCETDFIDFFLWGKIVFVGISVCHAISWFLKLQHGQLSNIRYPYVTEINQFIISGDMAKASYTNIAIFLMVEDAFYVFYKGSV